MTKSKKIENLAWLVLSISFCFCVMLGVGVPLGVRWTLRNATRPLDLALQPRAGTLTLRAARSDSPTLVIEPTTKVERKDRIELSKDGVALLLFYTSEALDTATADAPIVTVQLYGRTDLTTESARTPRFALSPHPHRVELNINRASNLHLTIEGNGRPAELRVHTPYGVIDMEEGNYVLSVEPNQTNFSVRAGSARIPDPETEEIFVLTNLQRTTLTAEGLTEITIGERDLLQTRNGSFEAPLEGYWTPYNLVGVAGEEEGDVRRVQVGDDRYIVIFTRAGQNFAETGITQQINQDIHEARSLRVRARIRIDAQTVGVCGSLGTECPVMVRITFIDQGSGAAREWLQGFYAVPGPDKPVCQSCEWQAEHIRVAQLGSWYDYESPDLLPLLKSRGINPAAVDTVRIYASGHTYSAAIDEVEILVEE
ncbi:MAG: hypothetical protein ACLFTI_06470 [Anaerolineales bacterium]